MRERPPILAARRLGRGLLNAAAGLSLAFILTPLVFVSWLAFFRQEVPSFPPEGYTLHWFANILGERAFVSGFLLSLEVGVAATALGLALGVPASLCLARFRFPGREALNTLLLLPLVVPGVVLGTSIYLSHIELEIDTGWPLTGSLAGLVIGHVLLVIPWSVRLVTAALFGFVASFGNLEMSLFLVGPGRTTLSIAILQYLEWKIDPTIAAVSVVQILLIAAALVTTDRYVKLARVV